MRICAALLLIAIPASADRRFAAGVVQGGQLRSELIAAGFAVKDVRCRLGDGCDVILPNSELKNPAAVIAAHVCTKDCPPELVAQHEATMKPEIDALEVKIEEESATAAEMRRHAKLLKRLRRIRGER